MRPVACLFQIFTCLLCLRDIANVPKLVILTKATVYTCDRPVPLSMFVVAGVGLVFTPQTFTQHPAIMAASDYCVPRRAQRSGGD
jgi:hypothetical protein